MATPKYTESQWITAQQQWRDADHAVFHARADARARYQDVAYAPSKVRRAIDVLARKEKRMQEKVYAILAVVSPRDWTRGIPITYVRESLTWADAITRGQLATIPKPAYGYSDQDSKQFARPLPEEITNDATSDRS